MHAAVSHSKGELAFVVLRIELWVPRVKSRHHNPEPSSPRVTVQAWGCTVEVIFLIGSKDPSAPWFIFHREDGASACPQISMVTVSLRCPHDVHLSGFVDYLPVCMSEVDDSSI